MTRTFMQSTRGRIAAYSLLSAALICLQYIKYRIPLDRFYSVILLFCSLIQLVLILSITAISSIQIFRHLQNRRFSAAAAVLACTFLLLFLLLVAPYTETYGILNQKLFYSQRQAVTEALANGEMDSYQINTNQYYLPDKYSFCSENARILTYDENRTVVFTVHRGIFAESGIVYSKSGAVDTVYFMQGAKVRKLSEDWLFFQKNDLVRFRDE
mgnify:CR=1 FL=1